MYAQAKLLVPTIRQIIKLGNDYNSARDDFERRYPSTGKLDENMDEYYKDPALNQSEKIVTDFMMELSEVEIDLVKAIMYVGREEKRLLNKDVELSMYDEDDDIEFEYDNNSDGEKVLSPKKMLASTYKFIKGDTKDISISHMLAKIPFPEYLRDGILILEL